MLNGVRCVRFVAGHFVGAFFSALYSRNRCRRCCDTWSIKSLLVRLAAARQLMSTFKRCDNNLQDVSEIRKRLATST
jgi:hypothetical protein